MGYSDYYKWKNKDKILKEADKILPEKASAIKPQNKPLDLPSYKPAFKPAEQNQQNTGNNNRENISASSRDDVKSGPNRLVGNGSSNNGVSSYEARRLEEKRQEEKRELELRNKERFVEDRIVDDKVHQAKLPEDYNPKYEPIKPDPDKRVAVDSYRILREYQEKKEQRLKDAEEKARLEALGPVDNKRRITVSIDEIQKFRKASKIEKYIVVVLYFVVILVGLYFIFASFYPEYLPFAQTSYFIMADDTLILNNLNSLYIDDTSVLGEKTTIQETSIDGESEIVARPIISPKKFNFVFLPKENIKPGKIATFEVNLILNESKGSNIYVDDELIFPNLDNYELLYENEMDYVYVNKDILPYINKDNMALVVDSEDYDSTEAIVTEDFIYENLPGASVWSTRELVDFQIDLPDYKKEETLINGTFRGDIKLAVFAEGDLTIDFVKQDLNMYVGPDEYTVIVTDFNGNEIYREVIGDDGVKVKGNLGKEQDKSIIIDDLDKGVYYVEFRSDNYNNAADITLKNININSNKILIVGTFIPWNKFNFYTKSEIPKTIGFMYWWTGKDQLIILNDKTTKSINLNESYLEKRYNQELNGDYNIQTTKGYVYVYNDYSSPKKENWFNIPKIQEKTFKSQNVLVIDKILFDKNNLNFQKTINLTKNAINIGLRVLETNSAYFDNAKLTFN